MLSHHASSAAPQTVQTAPPVCGAKNLSLVRLYSAPQLHRTIVAILGICAQNSNFPARNCATIKLIQRRSGTEQLCQSGTGPRPSVVKISRT
jgi:hypothetical protein